MSTRGPETKRLLDAVIGLGSNLGDRCAHIERACERISTFATILARSSIYETAPIGPAQPNFLNAAVRIAVAVEPEELLAKLLRTEAQDGRNRFAEVRFGPRTIDLDILWIKGRAVSTDILEIPHPRIGERAFALVPLYEVAPDAIDPRTGTRWPIPQGDTVRFPGNGTAGDVKP